MSNEFDLKDFEQKFESQGKLTEADVIQLMKEKFNKNQIDEKPPQFLPMGEHVLSSPIYKSLDYLNGSMDASFSKLKGRAYVFKMDQSEFLDDRMKVMESVKICD